MNRQCGIRSRLTHTPIIGMFSIDSIALPIPPAMDARLRRCPGSDVLPCVIKLARAQESG